MDIHMAVIDNGICQPLTDSEKGCSIVHEFYQPLIRLLLRVVAICHKPCSHTLFPDCSYVWVCVDKEGKTAVR